MEIKFVIFALVCFWVLLAQNCVDANQLDHCYQRVTDSPIVHTTSDLVRGQALCTPDGRVYEQFLGVRYATVANRFAVAQLADFEAGIKDGTDTQPIITACPQILNVTYRDLPGNGSPYRLEPKEEQLSEDCLHFHIYRPLRTSENRSLPILIYIHGGSFSMNSNSNEVFNGSQLAVQTNTIVAVPNYRLGMLGFLRLDNVTSGNLGLFDQALAIKWMRLNARSFGGDPSQITLFGNSAGGASVQYHLISNVSRHLFTRGAMLSGLATTDFAYQTPKAATDGWKRCVQALLSINADGNETIDLSSYVKFESWQNLYMGIARLQNSSSTSGLCQPLPTTDGVLVVGDDLETPANMVESGDFKQAETLVGMASQESLNLIPFFLGRDIMRQMPDVQMSESVFTAAIQMLGGSSVNSSELPEPLNDTTRWRALVASADTSWTASMNITLAAYVRRNIPVYRYVFVHPPTVPTYGYSLKSYNAAGHFDDMPFWFGLPLNPKYGHSAEEANLSRKMMNALGNFAYTGNPSSKTEIWLPYNENNSLRVFGLDVLGSGT